MKYRLLFLLCTVYSTCLSQTLQLHYDPRHTLDPAHNSANFFTIYFEYYKQVDTAHGSFFIKTQADLNGQNSNIGKFYTQVSRTFRFWQPKVYMQLQYSGGLGIAEPGSHPYYITNAYSAGPVYPFRWQNAWFSTSLSYQYNTFKKPSNDVMYSLYWGAGLFHYKMELVGDAEAYTLNKNTGDSFTAEQKGKRLAIFAEPQLWLNVKKGFSAGTKVNTYYHVLINDDILQLYPTVAVRFKFN